MGRRSKRSLKTRDADSTDRISALPDAIICHILTFMDTKYAVATCALSARWKDLHLYVPNIILDDSLNGVPKDLVEFPKFGLRQIMIRNVPFINQFWFKSNFIVGNPAIQTMVCAVVWRNVREVDISLELGESGVLPSELFTSRSLVVLKLRGGLNLDYIQFVSLPNLKVLLLDNMILPGDDSMRSLFQGCGVLESLSLVSCCFECVKVLDISIPSLRVFSSSNVETPNYIDHSKEIIEFIMDTPNLESFEYKGHEVEFNLVNEFRSLSRANISFIDCAKQTPVLTCDFVNKMHGLKSLILSGMAVEEIYSLDRLPPTFPTLTCLELGCFDLMLASILFKSVPLLEKLIIVDYGYNGDYFEYLKMEEMGQCGDVPMCLANHLRFVEFKEFEGIHTESGYTQVYYLLRNAKVLERMTFDGVRRRNRSDSAKRVEISTVDRASKSCEIVFKYVKK